MQGKKRKAPDDPETKRAKKRGRGERDRTNENPLASRTVCASCGQSGHANARAAACPDHRPNIKKKIRVVLGSQTEEFTRVVGYDSVVRNQYHDVLHDKIVELCAVIREIVIRAQVFVNGYIIDHAEHVISSYLYFQQFWYSVCQLVIGRGL